jgi:uncharacterized membrane protein YbaN (DUF454 family)
MSASKVHDSRLMRSVFLGLGIMALLLGVIGIFLPIMPTTPFILLAAGCFARGSERLHDWMLAQRFAGPIIRNWELHRSMPPWVKPWAFLMMAVSFGISIILVNSLWHRIILATIAAVIAAVLWRIPVRSDHESVRNTDFEI